MSVRSSFIWDVQFAPSRTNIQRRNRFLPNVTLGRHKKRRIIVEVIRPLSGLVRSNSNGFIQDLTMENDDKSVDIHNEVMMALLKGNKRKVSNSEYELRPNEVAVLRIFKQSKETKRKPKNPYIPKSKVRSDESISTVGFFAAESKSKQTGIWIEEYCCMMEDIEIVYRKKNKVVLRKKGQNEEQEQTIEFGSGFQSRSFFQRIINFQNSSTTSKDKLKLSGGFVSIHTISE